MFLSLSDNQHVAGLHTTPPAPQIHLQHKAGARRWIWSVGERRLKPRRVHSCPKRDKWQVNPPSGLSPRWSAAHFSFRNNNAGGQSFLLGPLVREWLGEETGPVIILSSTCPSCRVPPSLTHWRCRLLNPDETPGTTIASILVRQSPPRPRDCSRLKIGADTEGLAIIGISIMQSIDEVTSCMKGPICKRRWIIHCFHMGPQLMEVIWVNQVSEVLCPESVSELWMSLY